MICLLTGTGSRDDLELSMGCSSVAHLSNRKGSKDNLDLSMETFLNDTFIKGAGSMDDLEPVRFI